MDCSVMDTPAHDVPSPYLDLDSPTGIEALGYDRAAIHTAAAERLARLWRWEQAYDHLRAAVRSAAGRVGPGDELDRLRREHAEARELSRRDSLTATYNRRYLDECLATLLNQPVDPAVRTVGLSVALVDIDHFKLVNDTYGHLLGDRVLQRLVGVLGSGLPGGAFCAVRWRGVRTGAARARVRRGDRGLARSPATGGLPPVGRARGRAARHGQRGRRALRRLADGGGAAGGRGGRAAVHGQAGGSQRRGVPRRRHRVRRGWRLRSRAAVDPQLAHERTVRRPAVG